MRRKPGHDFAVIRNGQVHSSHTSIWAAKREAWGNGRVAKWDKRTKRYVYDLQGLYTSSIVW